MTQNVRICISAGPIKISQQPAPNGGDARDREYLGRSRCVRPVRRPGGSLPTRGALTGCLFSAADLVNGRGPDVLVEPEDVVRVVDGLDNSQPVVVAAVGVPYPIAAFFTEVVDVYPARVRGYGVEELAGPPDVVRRVGGVVPLGQDEAVVQAAAVGEGGR